MTSHRTILAFLLCLICIAHLPVNAQDSSTAMLIPIEREIDMAAFRHVKRGCTQAADENASLIIVQLNTYGGALDAADSIRSLLLRQTLPTVAWVNHNAASAGALIALACDSVFMATDASMGSATVVNGAGEPMPTKYQSYMATIMAATAEHHGRHTAGPDCGMWRRDPQTARAMVNPDSSLSLTAGEAIACGYAEGIADSLEEIASRMDMQGTRVVTYKATLGDDILGFLASAGVRAILVMLILGGIYMEMHTPGLGFAAAVALVAAVLYFLPMFATGSIEGLGGNHVHRRYCSDSTRAVRDTRIRHCGHSGNCRRGCFAGGRRHGSRLGDRIRYVIGRPRSCCYRSRRHPGRDSGALADIVAGS